jgi:hypothetical protein
MPISLRTDIDVVYIWRAYNHDSFFEPYIIMILTNKDFSFHLKM